MKTVTADPVPPYTRAALSGAMERGKHNFGAYRRFEIHQNQATGQLYPVRFHTKPANGCVRVCRVEMTGGRWVSRTSMTNTKPERLTFTPWGYPCSLNVPGEEGR